jgi:hypothetical protein
MAGRSGVREARTPTSSSPRRRASWQSQPLRHRVPFGHPRLSARTRWNGPPDIAAALKAYARVIYAAVAVRGDADRPVVEDLLDLFFHEHGTPLHGRGQGAMG